MSLTFSSEGLAEPHECAIEITPRRISSADFATPVSDDRGEAIITRSSSLILRSSMSSGFIYE